MEGLEGVLSKELEDLQLMEVRAVRRAVECEANLSQLYKCNYLLRTALRVLVPFAEFECNSEEELYEAAAKIRWHDFILPKQTFAIDATVSGEVFTHSQYVIYKVKDAIVDQLREVYSERPSIDVKNPGVRLNVHISKNKVTFSRDSSGQSLHLRNYKYRTYKAPLNEVLAAGIILLTGWDKNQTFQDPMCGSGTLITEALSLAGNIPAGKFIQKFGFENWPDFQADIWKHVRQSADDMINYPNVEIIASDLSSYAVRDVKKNLQKFPFKEKVKVFQRDFFKTHGHSDRLLVMNPPYDKRVALDDAGNFYKKIGDALKTYWKGSSAWIFSGNIDAIKKIGLRPSMKRTLFNGGIESKLYKFEMYEGSKKQKYNQGSDHRRPRRPRI